MQLSRLSDEELLRLVAGGRARAAALLGCAGGLGRLARLGPSVLEEHAGKVGALRLGAALELARRAAAEARAPRAPLARPSEVAALFGERLGPLPHEEMWVASLDGRCALRASRRVAQGGSHGCVVGAAEILRAALFDGAATFVLVHNHPSGDPAPSSQDVAMTQALAAAARAIGVPLADHVIVTARGHASLLELGLLEARAPPATRRCRRGSLRAGAP
jgi:DNA repair protein RadC